MNMHDSDRIAELLQREGYAQASGPEAADVVLLNTCSVREKAEQKLRSELGRLGKLKRYHPELVLAVAGCVGQQEGERLLKRVPDLDLVIGPDRIAELPELLRAAGGGAAPTARTGFDLDEPRFLSAQGPSASNAAATYVTVMKGCDERCSFCIVPHTRGPERYRPSTEIVEEIQRLVEAGVREVTLLGQTVNSYVDPLGQLPRAPGVGLSPWRHTKPLQAEADESEFAALLRRIVAATPELLRLRYTSPHPRHLTRSLIEAHRDLPTLVQHLHLPVQSGSDRVLRRMIRRYSVAEYLERVAALAEAVPGLSLSTDIIVGFPGETDDDFGKTLELVQQVGYVGLFGFKYSPRPDTPALELGDDVAEAEKSERLARLFQLTDTLRQAHLDSLVGTLQEVLVEGESRAGVLTGRSVRNEIVHFSGALEQVAQVVPVRIRRAFKNSLDGEQGDLGQKARRSLPLVG